MTRRQTVLLIVAGIVLLLTAAWYRFGGHRTAEGQPPLANLNAASIEQLRADFNASADETRIILLLSPT